MVKLDKTQNGYKIFSDGAEVGVIEYNDFWKEMPYLSLIKLLPEFRRKGIGREAMRLFEEEMKRAGNKALLLSTQVDEDAQRFYRKIRRSHKNYFHFQLSSRCFFSFFSSILRFSRLIRSI